MHTKVFQYLIVPLLFFTVFFIPLNLNISIISFFLLFTFLVIALVITEPYSILKNLQNKHLLLLNGLFFGVALFSIVINIDSYPSPIYSISKVKFVLLPLMMPFLWYSLTLSQKVWLKRRVSALVKIFSSGLLLSYTVGAIGLISGWNYLLNTPNCHSFRFCGAFTHFMSFAYSNVIFMNVLVCYLLWRHLERKKLSRSDYFVWLVLFTGVTINLFSFSRGSLIGQVLSLLPITYFFFSKRTFSLHLGSSLFLIILILFGNKLGQVLKIDQFSNKHIEHTHLRLMQPAESHSNLLRISNWTGSLLAAIDNPFFGVGYRNVEQVIVPYKKASGFKFSEDSKVNEFILNWKSNAHSSFFEILGGTGFLGAILALVWLFSLIWKVVSSKSKFFKTTSLNFFIAFVIMGIFQSVVTDSHMALTSFLIISGIQGRLLTSKN